MISLHVIKHSFENFDMQKKKTGRKTITLYSCAITIYLLFVFFYTPKQRLINFTYNIEMQL